MSEAIDVQKEGKKKTEPIKNWKEQKLYFLKFCRILIGTMHSHTYTTEWTHLFNHKNWADR